MKKINVLIQCAGGAAAVGLIKSLRLLSSDINIVGCDTDKLASGLYLSDKHYIVQPVTNDNIALRWAEIKNIIKNEKINFILPCGDHDLLILSTYKNALREMGVTTFVSSRQTIDICRDKYDFWKHCINSPLSSYMPQLIDAVFEKPNIGSGSRGVKLIKVKKDCTLWEYLPGMEYTVDVFCDLNSNVISTSVRKRLGVKAGISVKSEIIKHEQIEKISKLMCDNLLIKGPCCIQFKEDKNGNPKIIECNPRLGGGTFITTLAGINPAQIYIDLFKKQPVKLNQQPKPITVTRYYEEKIINVKG